MSDGSLPAGGRMRFALQLMTLLALLAGVALLGLQAVNTRETAAVQRAKDANDAWERFMKLSIEHPEFLADHDYPRMTGVAKAQYAWYVQYMLFSAEQVLLYAPDSEWDFTIVYEAKRHLSYLESDDFKFEEICSYTDRLKGLLAANMPEMRNAVAACETKLATGPQRAPVKSAPESL